MYFLHNFIPSSVAFTIGPLTIFWYGIVMTVAIVAGLAVASYLALQKKLNVEVVYDIAIWLIIGGIVGARLYEVLLNLPYYLASPQEVFQIWHGGLAIHGALLGGVVAICIYSKVKKVASGRMVSVLLPGLALGQAIGRWGNWFNQELFGLPTSSIMGIPIDDIHRPLVFENYAYFHPTFLYESLGCLIIAFLLFYLVRKNYKPYIIVGWYALLYGLLRFSLEFIKIDPTPLWLGLRWPQIISLMLMVLGIALLVFNYLRRPSKDS